MFGTYKIIEGLKKLCDEEWEKYCLLWNSGDHSYNPQCMWHFIEYHYINLDTKCAKHLLKNLKRIRDDKTFLEKVSGNLHPEWVYEYKTKTYKKEMKMVESREIYKDIISYIECVQNHLDYIEQISYMDNDEYIYIRNSLHTS